jgi:hypothetical protein
VMVAAFFAAGLVSMRITDCLAVEEEPGGIHPGSRCRGWSGCAASVIAGWRADALWPTGLACWSAMASPHVRKSPCSVMAGGCC